MSDFNQLIRNFWVKLVNGLAHSRSGQESMSTSYGPCRGTVWFNLGIQEYDMVTAQIKQTGTDEPIGPGQTYFVQFYLFTKEKRILVLETWELSASQTPEYVTKPLYLNVIEKMSGILKTVLMYSKHTTAHKCSLNQSQNWYIFCLKIGSSIPDHTMLGYDHESVNLGHLFTPTLRLNLSVHYRTKFALPNLDNISSSMMPIDPNHFKLEAESEERSDKTASEAEATATLDPIVVELPGIASPLEDIQFPFTSEKPKSPKALSGNENEPNIMYFNIACSLPKEKPKLEEKEDPELKKLTAQLRETMFGDGTELFPPYKPMGESPMDDLPPFLTSHQESKVDFYAFPSLSKKEEKDQQNVCEKLLVFSGHGEQLTNVIDFATQKNKEKKAEFY